MIVRLKLNFDEFAKFAQDLAERFEPATIRGVQAAAYRAVAELQQATVEAPPASPNGAVGAFNTGAFRRSWGATPLPDGARVYNTQPYAGVIEGGRRKGAKRPPPRAIEAWARRRLGLSEEDARAASFAIAGAIRKRGLRPRRVLRKRKPRILELMHAEVIHELQRELARMRSGAP